MWSGTRIKFSEGLLFIPNIAKKEIYWQMAPGNGRDRIMFCEICRSQRKRIRSFILKGNKKWRIFRHITENGNRRNEAS